MNGAAGDEWVQLHVRGLGGRKPLLHFRWAQVPKGFTPPLLGHHTKGHTLLIADHPTPNLLLFIFLLISHLAVLGISIRKFKPYVVDLF